MPPLGDGIPPLGDGIPPPLGDGIPPLGDGIPPDGGMGMPAPLVETLPVLLHPLTIMAATAIVRSGLSSGLPIRFNSLCRIGVRLSEDGNGGIPRRLP